MISNKLLFILTSDLLLLVSFFSLPDYHHSHDAYRARTNPYEAHIMNHENSVNNVLLSQTPGDFVAVLPHCLPLKTFRLNFQLRTRINFVFARSIKSRQDQKGIRLLPGKAHNVVRGPCAH